MATPTRRMIIVATFIALLIVGIFVFALLRPNNAPPFPSGVLRVGVDPTDPPFAFINETDELRGIDIELASALGETIGVRVEFVLLGYDGLYDALLSDRVDILLAALVVDPSRRDRVHYTSPYFNSGLVLVSPENAGRASMTQMEASRLAVAYGSEAHSEANRWLRRLAAFTRLDYETSTIALDAVRVGDANGALVDAISARLYLREHPDWRAQSVVVTVTPIAVAVRTDEPARGTFDRTMNELLRSGAINEIISHYLDDPLIETSTD